MRDWLAWLGRRISCVFVGHTPEAGLNRSKWCAVCDKCLQPPSDHRGQPLPRGRR